MPVLPFDSLDLVPEELRSGAKPVEGSDDKVTVNVVLNDTLKEFRENNIAISQQRDELQVANSNLFRIVGEDTKAFEDDLMNLRETARRVNDGELKAPTDIEEELAKRSTAMIANYEDQGKKERSETLAWKTKASDIQMRLENTYIDRAVTDAVLNEKSGVRPEAMADILSRARDRFVFEEGKVIPKNGDATIYGPTGTEPQTPLEWILETLKPAVPYYFKESSGGGANGGDTLTGGVSSADLSSMTAKQRLAYANLNLQK